MNRYDREVITGLLGALGIAAIALSMVVIVTSIGEANKVRIKKIKAEYTESEAEAKLKVDGERLSVVKIKGCEYILWHNGYGSDMEHHRNCSQCLNRKGEL